VQNGIYDFDRRPKFDIDRVRAVQQVEAAYERPEAEPITQEA
jgi:beta-glucuronidase